MFSTISFCCEALSNSAESISMLSGDLKSFLSSDDDVIPRSLRQAFRISHSEEFQETISVLTAALAQGLCRGVETKPRKELYGLSRSRKYVKHNILSLQKSFNDSGIDDATCRDIREISYMSKTQDQVQMQASSEGIPHVDVEKAASDRHGWDDKNDSSGSDMHKKRSRQVIAPFRKPKSAKNSEGFLEKLLSKLFSEPGVNFASTITGTFTRNLVLASFDMYGQNKSSTRDCRPSSSFNNQHTVLQTETENISTYTKVMDVLFSDQCRILIAECMQTFISTAVTVYIEKTKDVNFYNDLVAGITNPSHKDSVKEMLISVCNGAVETLVKTSYDVLKDGELRASDSDEGARNDNVYQMEEHLDIDTRNMSSGSLVVIDREPILPSRHFIEYDHHDTRSQGTSAGGVQGFMGEVSRTLAIPSNQKLILDVAGRMSSEAVKSFLNAVISIAISQISSKMHGSWNLLKKSVASYPGSEQKQRTGDTAAKAYILASVSLAICLHVLSGSEALPGIGLSS
ncbi:hypothetical protein KP509_06G022200 [Ceratopteris richardii]|nr:hypothetical protein KP509_06G022200 [Ceratopteris richardii]